MLGTEAYELDLPSAKLHMLDCSQFALETHVSQIVDPKRAAWLAYDVQPDGAVTNGRVFFDATRWRKDPFFGPDGFKVDRQGNIFGARSGGLSVIAPDGTLLGTVETGQPTSNVAWGEDGQTLFITGGSSVYRIRLTTGAAWY